ncbi:dihydrofolate reductase [Siminovitchia terrae]|uniref:D-2-hydroxyacid dehydrogenase n=1 Tax=Siminovitchia terrae TaxID=1914933 RepID=A0A429X6F4_SIMTE|nr:D-2-hydroxyacid dehydrogenase [Siminovitchia terrae]RST58959.1 D-2-hydroxyacid dehydrogenase [Siminovitchia terrae]GIN89053.1 dihydrofolate reductase [Siminovitchia terrae]
MIVCTTSDISNEIIKKVIKETGCKVVQKKIQMLKSSEKYETKYLLTYGNFDDEVNAEELEQLPNLKWIHVLSSGTEQLPQSVIKDRDILVTSSKGIHAIPISEYVLGAILHFAKRITEFRKLQDQMSWSYTQEMFEVYGKTLGILGTGSIGSDIAEKAKVFGMNVIGVNRSGRRPAEFDQVYKIDQLKEMVPLCDYICCILPSTKETIHLIGQEIISLMKDQVIFINVGRGDLVIEEDLLKALKAGKIGGAALDVFKEEPLKTGHPFWSMENVLVTPHASARTKMYMNRAINLFLDNYKCYQKRQLDNMVNKVTFN